MTSGDPELIRRARQPRKSDPASEGVAEAEKKRAQADAEVGKAEAGQAMSLIARVLGSGEDATRAASFIIILIVILSVSAVLIFSGDHELRIQIMDFYKFAFGGLVGYLAGSARSSRRR
jgi:hypothetical protein